MVDKNDILPNLYQDAEQSNSCSSMRSLLQNAKKKKKKKYYLQ